MHQLDFVQDLVRNKNISEESTEFSVSSVSK